MGKIGMTTRLFITDSQQRNGLILYLPFAANSPFGYFPGLCRSSDYFIFFMMLNSNTRENYDLG